MNNFLISTGAYVTALTKDVLTIAKKIGAVTVAASIKKIEDRGNLGNKKKTVKC